MKNYWTDRTRRKADGLARLQAAIITDIMRDRIRNQIIALVADCSLMSETELNERYGLTGQKRQEETK